MTQVIIYPKNGGGTFNVVVRVDKSLSIEDIAAKDVPAGVGYKIVDSVDFPPRDLRGSWTADFSRTDGEGEGHEEWARKRTEKL